jgi:hypothetical protein
MQPRFPVRAAFYYPWFPEAWSQRGVDPFTKYSPSLGLYDSGSGAVIRKHLRAMEYARIEVAISSWWGRDHRTDARLHTLLARTRAAGSPLRWATYYEQEGSSHGRGPNPSVAQLRADLEHIRTRHARQPAYFRIGGRFVVFVWGDSGDGCATATRWRRASRGIGAYVVLKVFGGSRICARQPRAWHQYAPAVAEDRQDGWSFSVSPGFDKATEASPRLERDLGRWRESVRRMAASREAFQLVTTFNEWGEGTAVESAREWASPSGFGAYLDALHDRPTRK